MKRNIITALVLILVFTCVLHADWPQFMGPDRNGISPEKGLKRSWPKTGPKVLWTFPLNKGFGGPVISKGKVYIHDRIIDKKDIIYCLNLSTGKEEWKLTFSAEGTHGHPGSRSVPTIDGNYLYTCNILGDIYCISLKTRKLVWKKNLWHDFGGGERIPMWGLTQNPLIYKDLLIIGSQTEKAGVVAFNKLTGAVKWISKPFKGRPGYVSPQIVTIHEKKQIVMISAGHSRRRGSGKGRGKNRKRPPGRKAPNSKIGLKDSSDKDEKGAVMGFDPGTGKLLWNYEGWQCQTPVPNVVESGSNRLFITAGYQAGSAMLRIDKKGNGYSVKELYKTMDFGTHIHPPILYKGYFYAHCSDNHGRKDGMTCMDLNGKIQWRTKKDPSFDKGGFILADGLILSIDGAKGILYLIKPGPRGFEKLASAQMLDTTKCWTPLALTDGKLLIRDQEEMKCVLVK